MRRKVLTREEVFAACDELHEKAIPISLKKLLEKLGGGGFNTLIKYRREWTEERSSERTALGVPESLSGPLKAMWKEALDHANEQLESVREELAASAEELDERHEKDQEAVKSMRIKIKALDGVLSEILDGQKGFNEGIQSIHPKIDEGNQRLSEELSSSLQKTTDHLEKAISENSKALTSEVGNSLESRLLPAISEAQKASASEHEAVRAMIEKSVTVHGQQIQMASKESASELEKILSAMSRAFPIIASAQVEAAGKIEASKSMMLQAVSSLDERQAELESNVQGVISALDKVVPAQERVTKLVLDAMASQQSAFNTHMSDLKSMMSSLVTSMSERQADTGKKPS